MTARPTLKVEFGFGSTWQTADSSIVWTDVTKWVRKTRGLGSRRGRSSELDEHRAGSCSFELDNSDRRFDPQHASGPYFANLKPGVPVKVTGTANSTAAQGFRGFLGGWPQDYLRANRLAVVVITATDGFEKLATAATPVSPYALHLQRNLEPERWFPLSDAAGSLTAVDLGTVPESGTAPNEVTFGADTLDGGGSAATFVANAGIKLHTSPSTPTRRSVSFIIKTTAASGHAYFDQFGTGGFRIAIGSDAVGGFLQIGDSTYVRSNVAINDGQPHQVTACANSPGLLYIDGVDRNAGFVSGASAPPITNEPTIAPNFVGTLAHLAFHETDLTSTDAGNLNSAFLGWSGDLTGARIGRLLDVVGWPADLRDIATGLTTLGRATLGTPVLSLLRSVEAAEQGRFFISRAGKATFRDRYYHQTVTEGTTAQATFSDGAANVSYSGLGYDYDLSRVLNRIRASRSGGQVITVSDATSIATHGERTDDVTGLDLQTDAEVRSLAEYRLDRYKSPSLRARPISVLLQSLPPAQQATVLALELGYRVNLKRTPQGVGSAIDADSIVESIDHEIEDRSWRTTLTLSPVDTRVHAVWGTSLWDTGLWGY